MRKSKKALKEEVLSQIKISGESLSWLKEELNKASETIQERVKNKQVADDGSIMFRGETTSLVLLEKKVHALINKSFFEKKLFLDLCAKYEKLNKKDK